MAIRTTGVRYDLIARDSASRTFNQVGGTASKLEKGLGKLGKAALAAGAALTVGVAAGLAEGAKKAVEFQAEMLKIQTQAGASAKDVKVLSGQVLELGKTAQQGPQQLSEALYHLKSVGMDNVDAMKALKTASDLAAVGGADLEATTNALAGAWRTGIKGAETFSKTAATVNAVIGAGNMTMEDMVSALGTGILPTAKTFGLTLSQVGAALALFTDEGVDSASAATRLRMSISLLAAGTPAANKQLKKIHLTTDQLGTAMRTPDGIIGAIKLLKSHLDDSGLSAVKQAALLSRAFGGGKSSSAILSMVNNLDVLEQKQKQVNSSMGKYGPAVQAQRKTAAAQIAIIKSNLEVFAIKTGNVLLPPLTNFVTYITMTALPAVHHFGHEMATKFVPVDQIKSGFATAQGMVSDFFDGFTPKAKRPVVHVPTPQIKGPTIPPMLRRPYTFTVPSPQLKNAKSTIPSMIAKPKEQVSQAKQFGLQLRGLISGGIGDALKTAWKGIDWGQLGKTIGSGLATAIGWVGEHMADLSKKVMKALSKLDYVEIGKSFGKMAIPLAIGIIGSLFDPLFSASFWKKHWLDTIIAVISVVPIGRVAGAVGKVFTKIPVLKMFAPLLERIGGLGKLVEKPLGKALEGVWAVVRAIGRGFVTGFEKVFPETSRMLSRKLDDLVLGIFGYTSRAGAAGLRVIEAVGRGIIRGGEGVGSAIGRVVGYVVKPFADAGSWLLGKGSAAVAGLRSGIATAAGKLGVWVTDHLVTPVTSRFAAAGSWLMGRGSAIVSGLRSGIEASAKTLGSWLKTNVVDKITVAFGKASGWLTAAGAAVVSGLFSGATGLLSDAKNGVMHWAGTVKDKIVGAIKAVFGIHSPSTVMAELGGHMMSGLLKGLLSGKDVLESTVKGIFHSPLDAAQALLSNGVSLPGKWLDKLLSAKAPTSADVPVSPNVASAQQYAQKLIAQMWPGNAAGEWNALRSLWNAESGWRANAMNASSGAYGIPQALPANKMASAGADWRTNAATQINWGLSYIRGRYGDPQNAWESWNAHKPHWYAKGTPGSGAARGWAWVGEKGPELVRFGGGEQVLSHLDSLMAARSAGIQIPGYASGTGRSAAAQRRVNSAQAAVDYWRHREAAAHTKAQKHIDSVNLEAARRRLSAAKAELAAAKKQQTQVTSVANTIANGFLRTLETGTASAIASAVKSMNTKLQAAGAGSLVAGNLRTSAQLQSLATRKAGLASQIAAAQSYAGDQAGKLGDFLDIGSTSATTPAQLIQQMSGAQHQAQGFATLVANLAKRGLNKGLLAQLGEAGPGSSLQTLFTQLSGGDIAQLNRLAASQAKLTTSFGNQMADAMYDSGAQAGRGFLAGLKAQEAALQAQMDRLALGMVNTIKKRLGIHSPSRVMHEQVGKQTALGMVSGMRAYTPHVEREAQRMADTAAAVRARGTAGAQAGGVQVIKHECEHSVVVNFRDDRLSDLIDVRVEPKVKAAQKKAAFRAKVGSS